MKILFKDVQFVKCEEYNPFNVHANGLGIRTFWRADYNGVTIVSLCASKAEC